MDGTRPCPVLLWYGDLWFVHSEHHGCEMLVFVVVEFHCHIEECQVKQWATPVLAELREQDAVLLVVKIMSFEN